MLLDRVELYSKLVAAETKIETSLIIRRLIWVGVGAVFALFALAMAHTAILAFFWHTEFRVWAVAGVLLVDVVIAGIAIYMASRPAKEEAFAVTNVPTFIVMKNGKEIGRVVEYGKTGMPEKEVAQIIAETKKK